MTRKHKKCLVAMLLCAAMLIQTIQPLPVMATFGNGGTTTETTEGTTEGTEEGEAEGSTEGTTGAVTDTAAEDAANREKLEQLQNQSAQLAEEAKNLKAQINNASSQKAQQQAIKETLDARLVNTVSQIAVLEEKISLLQAEIEISEKNIADLEETIEQNYQLFLQRVRASYMYGDIQPMSVVLGADDYYDSLVAAKTIESVAKHDNELIESLHHDKQEVEDIKAQQEEDKRELNASVKELDEQRESLEGEISAAESEINSIAALEAQFKKDLAANQKMSQELQAEMNVIFAQISANSQGEYVGGEMLWPVPGFSNITSYYGWRWNKTDYHTGIDISGSGINGSTILAANSGTVAKVNTSYVPGKGYGVYVIIDHGGGTVSLYGHCLAGSIMVSEGQTVAKGTPIAKVGSTGWSTGPHLHFEVRVNGNHTNPLAYLKG